jgi:hypothetical protein
MSYIHTWQVVTVPGTGTFVVFKYISSLRNYMTNFIQLLSHISIVLPSSRKITTPTHAYMIPASDVVTSKQDRE